MKAPSIAVLLALAVLTGGPACAAESADWANTAAYRADNEARAANADDARVVFMGDSITEFWDKTPPALFAERRFVNRGISGQTTPQMLVRFRPDVIALKPKVVVILAGTNDIAGNTGPTTLEAIEGNIASMSELAKANGIRVVLCSVLPAQRFYWVPEIAPARQIATLNQWIKDYAARNGYPYVDYYAPMADAAGGLKKVYSEDGVHPNSAGYAVMRPLVEAAVSKAMAGP